MSAAFFRWRARAIPILPAASFSSASRTLAQLDNQYTTFGKVIKGDDVLEKIGDTEVAMSRGERSKPTKRVSIESIKIVPADSVK